MRTGLVVQRRCAGGVRGHAGDGEPRLQQCQIVSTAGKPGMEGRDPHRRHWTRGDRRGRNLGVAISGGLGTAVAGVRDDNLGMDIRYPIQ
jgi:hypothetical protein